MTTTHILGHMSENLLSTAFTDLFTSSGYLSYKALAMMDFYEIFPNEYQPFP